MNNVLTLLGFAKKSGDISLGETLCVEGINKRKVSLLIIARDLNESTRNKMMLLCESKSVPYRVLATKEVLSHAIGKTNYGLIGITSKNFSRALIEKIDVLLPEVDI